MLKVCKILTPNEWAIAQDQPAYSGTPLDEKDGFIHLSTPEQVTATLQRFFPDIAAVVILTINGDHLGEKLKFEENHGKSFPHLYGKLPISAVTGIEYRRCREGWTI